MSDTQALPDVAGIKAAHGRIDPVFLDTPLIGSDAADAALGCTLLAKVETLNPTRAFKGRGTGWLLEKLPASDTPLVAASAGNFGQGLAYAGRRRGRKVIMFAATTANSLKIKAMRRFGAEVILEGADFDAAKQAAKTYASQRGYRFIEDGALAAIAEGAGTIALEITRELARRRQTVDAILVPLGNGALLTGIGTWMKSALPDCRVIGIVAQAAPAMLLSWQQHRPVATPAAPTMADGIAVREPVPYALECMRSTVDDVWTVSEDSILRAMRFCHEHFGLVVEPAGAAGVGAALEHAGCVQGKTIATVLCGGSLTREQITRYLGI